MDMMTKKAMNATPHFPTEIQEEFREKRKRGGGGNTCQKNYNEKGVRMLLLTRMIVKSRINIKTKRIRNLDNDPIAQKSDIFQDTLKRKEKIILVRSMPGK